MAKLVAADADAGDNFGSDVAIHGSIAVVGAPGDDQMDLNAGAAYVYRLVEGEWVEEEKLLAPDGAEWDQFGRAVAICGDAVLVGAVTHDANGISDAGAAYIYRHNGSEWVLQQKLVASDAAAKDYFGWFVSLDDAVALIGAPQGASSGSTGPGAAYVFRLEGSEWIEEAKLVAGDGALWDLFGIGVSVNGDAAVVGAPWDDDYGEYSGSVYVFLRTGSVWTERQKLTPSHAGPFDTFGSALSVDGDRLVVGGNDGGGSEILTAHFFRCEQSTWTEASAVFYDGGALGWYAGDVALRGDTALLGAALDDDAGTDSGAVLVYRARDAGWILEGKWTAADGAPEARVGRAVAIEGTAAFAGANYNDPVGEHAGSTYVLDLNPVVGDVTCDGIVDHLDLLQLLAAWGPCTGCIEDLNNDGVVNVADLLELLAVWGRAAGS